MALDSSGTISPAELRLAARNHGLPLEALAYDVTPAGLHYLLTHYDIPLVDPASFRLTVGGLVGRGLSLSLDELRARPAVTHAVTLECAGNGRTGMSPRPIDEPFGGDHQRQNYCLRQAPEDEGVPLSRMQPRSLLIPPGIPDSGSRERTLAAGPLTVRGRAWSGLGEIARVEASADGVASWSDARLAPVTSRWAWRAWEWEWDARPGEYELCCRATDETGAAQPLEAPWNLGGYINNEVQRVPVRVSQLDV